MAYRWRSEWEYLINMATLRTEGYERRLFLLFEESMQPIYPNLIKKQTKLEFMNINSYRKQKKFLRGCIPPSPR